MATIAQAVAKGVLEVVPLPSWEMRLAIRPLWATPELLALIEEMPVLHGFMLGRRTAYEHLWQFLSDFRCSARPGAGGLRTMLPTDRGIWTIHPPEAQCCAGRPG